MVCVISLTIAKFRLAIPGVNIRTKITDTKIRGAPGWIRTSDLELRSLLLYPTELPGHVQAYRPISFCPEGQKLASPFARTIWPYASPLNFQTAARAASV